MKRKLIKAISLLMTTIFVTGALAACGQDPVVEGTSSTQTAAASNTQNKKDTFTYAIAGDPQETINPITTSDRWGLTTLKMIYSPLFMNNADGVNWFLATDYSTTDNLTYTFHLRKDVKWSDGQPFTADDVVFTYDAMEKQDNLGWAYSQLVYNQGTVQVTKVDDYTVSFTFPFQTPTALEMLSQIFIMPKHIYENVTDFEHNDFNTKSVGTGPYKLVDYQAGSYLKFEANENYFAGKPEIKNIVFRIIEDSNTALLALQSKEVDAYQALPSEIKSIDLKKENLNSYSYGEGRIGYLMINANRVTDQNVRKAILFALNKDQMNQAAYLSKDYYETPYSFLPTSSQFYTADLEKYTQDDAKSQELLKQANATNLTLTLGYSESDKAQATQALLIQEQLKKAGITVNLASTDSTALSAAMKDKNNSYDMYLGGYIMGIDPDTFSSLFESNAAYNYMHYQNKDIDTLFEQGRNELDPEKRKEIYTKLQQAIADEATFYPIVSNNKILVIDKRIQGIEKAKLVPVYTFEDTSYLSIAN